MRKILLCLVLTINWVNISYSQKPEYVLIVNFQDKEYFAPDILNCLNNLNISKNNRSTKAFDKIINLNQLQRHKKEQEVIRNITDFFNQNANYMDLSEGAKRLYDSISKYLGNYNSWLDINTNQINDLIELQFSLYTNILKEGDNNFAIKDPRFPTKYQSVVFIPQEENYLHIVEKNIRKLFPETNVSPNPIVFVNGKHIIKGEDLFFATGDTIVLDGSYSSDQDSRKEDLTYLWRIIDTLLFKSTTLPIDFTNPRISFSLNKPGEYCFGLTIFDGINYSLEDSVRITVIMKPRIFIENDKVDFFYQKSASISRKKNIFNYVLNISSSTYDTDPSYLYIKDLNKNLYLNNVDPLQIAEKYLEYNFKVPPLDTIRKKLYQDFKPFNQSIILDTITNPKGGYKLSFSGYPNSTTYSFKVNEKYKGVSSNYYVVNFNTDFLSSVKLGFKYQIVNLFSNKISNWGDTTNLNQVSDSNKFVYINKNFYPYLSFYITRRLTVDWNLNTFYYKFANKFPSKYVPLIQFSYEFGTPDYLMLAPTFSYGASLMNKDNSKSILGFGIVLTRCFSRIVFISMDMIYLEGIGNDFGGTSLSFAIRLDVKKIYQKFTNSKNL